MSNGKRMRLLFGDPIDLYYEEEELWNNFKQYCTEKNYELPQ